MTIMNKLNAVSSQSVAQVNRIKNTAATQTQPGRPGVADSGKGLPTTVQKAQVGDVKKRELNSAVKNISGYVQNITRELNFSIDESLGQTVVTVVDEKSGDVIRQIPSEDMLELSKSLADAKSRTTKGILFQTDV